MRIAGRLAAELLDYITPFVKIGITTNELNQLCHDYTVAVLKAESAQLNYPNQNSRLSAYHKSICASVNSEICHGIPNDKPLKNGDIVNIDVTVLKNGYFGDHSRMFCIGTVSPHAKRLCQITFECMWHGIEMAKAGNYLGDIGYAIQTHAEKNGYSVVREFCGHGIGRQFHESLPQVLHYGKPKTGIKLQPGMIFTIEPMINQGSRHVKFMSNGWTAVTKDRSLSAQWEHTILIKDSGYEVLTLSSSQSIPVFIKP